MIFVLGCFSGLGRRIRRFPLWAGTILAGVLLLGGCTNVSQMHQRYQRGDHAQLDRLIEIVSRPDYPYATRRNAARVLGEIGDPKAAPVLIGVLEEYDRRTTLKEEALRALGKIGAQEAIEPIGQLLDRSLNDPNAELRMAALPVLGSLGGVKSAEILVNALRFYDLVMLQDEHRTPRGIFTGQERPYPGMADSLGRERPWEPGVGVFSSEQVSPTGMFGTELPVQPERYNPTPEERALAHAALVETGDEAILTIQNFLANQEATLTLKKELQAILGEIRQEPATAPDTSQTGEAPEPKGVRQGD